MIVSLVDILSKHGRSVVQDIRTNLDSSKTNATGKTSNSIQYSVTEDNTKTILWVYGRPFVFTVETGRGPRRENQDYKVSDRIREWMDARGIGTGLTEAQKEQKAKSITFLINKYGSKLHRKGGRKDIISNVVNQSLYDQITEDVMNSFANSFMDNIKIAVG
jgi:hypothetical protein